MEIEDAFTQKVIASIDVNVEGDDEEQLRAIIRSIYESNNMEYRENEANIAVLCFVAGRAYQYDLNEPESTVVTVPMSGEMVGEFIEFLSQKGET
jgi:hypothetical protein